MTQLLKMIQKYQQIFETELGYLMKDESGGICIIFENGEHFEGNSDESLAWRLECVIEDKTNGRRNKVYDHLRSLLNHRIMFDTDYNKQLKNHLFYDIIGIFDLKLKN